MLKRLFIREGREGAIVIKALLVTAEAFGTFPCHGTLESTPQAGPPSILGGPARRVVLLWKVNRTTNILC